METRFKIVLLGILSFSFLSINLFASTNRWPNKTADKNESGNARLLLLKYHFTDPQVLSIINNGVTTDEVENNNFSSKSPWLAFFLSAVFPGLGQLYNGDFVKAIIQPLLFGGGALLASSACFDCSSTNQSSTAIGLGLAFGSYIWSIIDAPISANSINANINRNSGLVIFSSNKGNLTLDFNSLPQRNINALSVRMNF